MAENMTPAEQQIRDALAAGPTPGPWHGVASKHGEDFGILDPHQQNVLAEVFSDIRHDGERAIREAAANAKLIAACNPAAVAELLAELVCERLRSQMYADLVRGVAVVLHGEGWSDTSKLPEEVASLRAEVEALRAERDTAVGTTALRCIEMAKWPQGIDDEQAFYGRMFAEFIEREFRAAIDAAKGGE